MQQETTMFRPHLLYRGETETELENKFLKVGGIDNRPENRYTPLKPCLGTVFVSKEYKESWIWSKISFLGWNIIKET